MLDRIAAEWSTATDDPLVEAGGPTNSFEWFDDAWIERPLVERFLQIAARFEEKVAVADESCALTYRALRRAAFHLAPRIASRVAKDLPIAVLLPSGAAFPVAALACLAVGRPYIFIDPACPTARIDHIVTDAGVAAVVTSAAQKLEGFVASLPRLDIEASLTATDDRVATIASADGPAVILYTSGSTGRPKGICNAQRAILQRVAQATNSCHLTSDDRLVVLSSPGTIAGIRETFVALLNGMTLHVADPARLGINGVLQCVEDAQVTLGYMVPALLRQLLGAPAARHAFRHMRIIRTGGDIPLASDIALCRATLPASCRILIAFSSTEVPTIFQWFVPRHWEASEVRLPIGYARRGMSFRLLDEEKPVPHGEVGELVVKSRYLALGYWQEGRLHPGPFLTDPDDPAVHILHTGDLVRLRPDGLAEMIGRKDRQIKIRGLRTDLGEIEAAMRTCRGVADAAVIVRRRAQEDATLVAFAVAGEESDASSAELRAALARRLPSHMCPSRIHVIDAIPQLPGFKPDLAALERIDAAQEGRVKTVRKGEKAVRRARRPPADAKALASVRAAVARAWTIALDRRSFRADQAWDEAGGDSLKALHLCCLIEESLGRRIPMEKFEPGMTPTRLVAMIAKGVIRQPDPAQCAPLVFFVPPADGDTPMLAKFRAACGEGIRFEVIQYPQWREMMRTGAAFDSLVDATVAQVIAAAADGKISLAGYSFGGFVAWEAAQRLVASGRTVEFLGLIDTQLAFTAAHQGSWRRARYLLRKAATARRAAFDAILERSFRALARQAKLPLLNGVGALINMLPARLAFELNYHLTYQLRVQSRRSWTPAPLQAPTYLFRTDEFSPQAAQATWGHLANKLEVISVGGDHWSVLQPPLRERLCQEFVAAVTAAQCAGRGEAGPVGIRSRSSSRSRRTRSRSGC